MKPKEKKEICKDIKVGCEFCGEPHDVKNTIWIVENSILIEINAPDFYYCPTAERILLMEEFSDKC